MRILILNGPNLNLLGTREPEIYGNRSFDDFLKELRSQFPDTEVNHFQSNHEGELIDQLQQADSDYDAIILNAGGYTHTSVAIADAVAALSTPVMEVHISNPLAREPFRHRSLLASPCVGTVSGLGLNSYRLAMKYFLQQNDSDQ